MKVGSVAKWNVKYTGSTMQARLKFMRQYDTYLYALSAFQTKNSQPFIMPVGACIAMEAKKRLAAYKFKCGMTEVTEEQWLGYFSEALTPKDEDFAETDHAMLKLKMDTSLPEAPSRVDKLVADMHAILDETNMDRIMPEREQKKSSST